MTAVLESAPSIQDAIVEDETLVPEASPSVDETMQETKPVDYSRAAGWGIASAIATSAVSVTMLPVQDLPLAFILGAGLGVFGYLDHQARMVRNTHTLIFGVAATILILATQISLGGLAFLQAGAAATVTFALMLVLARALPNIPVRGGHIKLSPVPAALLGAISPLAALLWLLFTAITAFVSKPTGLLTGKRSTTMAVGSCMAFAVIPALGTYGVLRLALGL